MQQIEDHGYFERRADEEQAAAEVAADERAAHSHRELAEQYRKLAAGQPVEGAQAPIDDAGEPGTLPRDFTIVP